MSVFEFWFINLLEPDDLQKFLETAVAKKKKFREFLQSVVEDEKTQGRFVAIWSI